MTLRMRIRFVRPSETTVPNKASICLAAADNMKVHKQKEKKISAQLPLK
jgi:hypothetical protein